MKVQGTVEQIFSHAVALDQSGGLRNTVYAIGNEIYILNYDHTVLLRFLLRKSEAPFQSPVSFRANDYDSNEFHEEDGRVIFLSEQGGYIKKKSCGTPDMEPSEVQDLFRTFEEKESRMIPVILSKDVLSLLERELSHTEFVGKKGDHLKLVQRNIYSGGIIEIQQQTEGLLSETEPLPRSTEPMAIKTDVLAAMFAFQDALCFHIPVKGKGDYIMVKSLDSRKRDMKGFIAGCLYDEIIEIKEAGNNGGKE